MPADAPAPLRPTPTPPNATAAEAAAAVASMVASSEAADADVAGRAGARHARVDVLDEAGDVVVDLVVGDAHADGERDSHQAPPEAATDTAPVKDSMSEVSSAFRLMLAASMPLSSLSPWR